ncbi:hypothetical protein P8629_02570 [Hydrogenovibrio sp. 3SP14C1]|uniref:hypothetical protein n=1 Tax=Hydrogenovibrio sp. 3SP14C1 TaxID=3038774 RepID=UPI002415A132|nr:hypothetical protein [Hydrogenovibrio sp. 3SP14C1]MDG4811880.1 hypothetical protein [Hydrogenovibrio sp. 3SP14C1]
MNYILYVKEKEITVIEQQTFCKLDHEVLTLDWSDDSAEKFLKSLSKYSTVTVVLDFIDENLHYEWVPKLLPWEKPVMVDRLTAKAKSEGSLFVHAKWLPVFRTNASGREEQQLLIASVLRSPEVERLFGLFETLNVTLIGVYSYAFLMGDFFFAKVAPRLHISRKQLAHPFLLVIRESHCHFRQIFFHHGVLKISRHIDLEDVSDDEALIASALIHETKITVKYLYNQKILPINAEVGFVYLAVERDNENRVVELFKQTIPFSNWQSDNWFAKAGNLNELLHLQEHCRNQGAMNVLMTFLFKVRPGSFYHVPYAVRIKRFLVLRKGMYVIWITVALLGSYGFIQQGIDNYLLSEKTQWIETQSHQLQLEKSQLQRSIDLKYNAEDIKAIVEFSEALLHKPSAMIVEADLEFLSQVLQQHSHILMTDLKWRVNQQFDSDTLLVSLSGQVIPFNKTYEQPVKWVDDFVSSLAKSPKVQFIDLIQEPLDRRTQKSLQVDGKSNNDDQALPFAIRFNIQNSRKNPASLKGEP